MESVPVGLDDVQPALNLPASRSEARVGAVEAGSSRPAERGSLSSFRAPWPSLLARNARWVRPLMDIYFVSALFIFYAIPTANGPPAWRAVKRASWAFIWLPFVYRFFAGFVHWMLSLVIMPGSVLFMQAHTARLLPKRLRELIHKNNARRRKRRAELVLVTGGLPVQLITPDGVTLDAIYWAGRNAERSGATVVRLNGNAEAFEMQDDTLPLMYSRRGLNVLLFNYRGVGDSRWPSACGSDLLGHLLSIWSVPAATGLQLDVWTAVQFLLRELRVRPEHLCLIGHSMGGAVAARFLAQRCRIPIALCISRSFGYLSIIAGNLAPIFCGIEETSLKARMLRHFVAALVLLSGWQHRCACNFLLATGAKWIEFCDADQVIPLRHSLPAALCDRHRKLLALAKERQGEGGQQVEGTGGAGGGAMGRMPLSDAVELEDLEEGLVEWAGFRCMKLIGLNGLDNHNRLWMDEEAAIHIQLVKEALGASGATCPSGTRAAAGTTRYDI